MHSRTSPTFTTSVKATRSGLGHAVSVARKHVGDNPFVVLLGDDIIDERLPLLEGMIETYERLDSSVIALMEVADPSLYGCARTEPEGENLVRVLDIVEKPAAADAPSNLAVMGRYVFTPEIFDALAQVQPGVGGEIQLTDAIALVAQGAERVWLHVLARPLRHRQQARLPACHGRARRAT